MALMFDGAVVIILIVTALMGYCRGFVRYVIAMLGTVAAVAAAFVIAGLASENVYNKYVKTEMIAALESAVDKADVIGIVRSELVDEGVTAEISDEEIKSMLSDVGSLADNAEKLLFSKGAGQDAAQEKGEELSDYLRSVMPEKLSEKLEGHKAGKTFTSAVRFGENQLEETLRAVSEGGRSGAEYLEKNVVRPVALTFIRIAVFVISFVLIDIVIKLILLVSGIFTGMPALSAANRFGGMALGLVKGMLYITLIAFLVCLVINTTGDSLAELNSRMCESTYLFKYFFDVLYK